MCEFKMGSCDGPLFAEFSEQGASEFLDGSARIALEVRPTFTTYIFIEKDKKRLDELRKLKSEYLDVHNNIVLVNDDSSTNFPFIQTKYFT